MALQSKKEFAALCGIKSGDLSNYIKRGHVIAAGEYIDDKNELNALFLKKREAKAVSVKEPKIKAEKVAKSAPELSEEDKREQNSLMESERQKRNLSVRSQENTIRLQEMEIQKKQGELIPTKSIRGLIIQHSESMKTAYAGISDNLIEIMAQKKQFTAVEIADLRAQNLRLINQAIDEGIAVSKEKLAFIVEDYSEKKGVGQHG